MKIIGKSFRKVDARSKCTGQTKFADDIVLPRMLFCKILRSTVAHANIKKIDMSKALSLHGVIAGLTGKEVPIKFGILPVSEDEHALCVDRVRYVGDPVAAIAAIDEDTAEEAIEAIEVDYEPLKTIMSIDDAVKNPEPRIQDYGDLGNLQKIVSLEFGEVDKALESSDYTREDILFYQGSTHLPMEQHAAVAQYDADGRLTLWSSTQTPHYVHRALAKVLQIPASMIRVIATPSGGGFGGKSDIFSHEIVVAKLAMMTGRPVKTTLTREEVFYAHRGRHPTLMWIKTGFKNGKLQVMDFKSFLDGGAYGSYGVAATYYTGALQTVAYHLENYRFRGCRAFTNKPPCGPKRGHGTPQPRYAVEIHLDKVAEDLKIDPTDLRKKILIEPNSVTANWFRIGSVGLGKCIDAVVEGSDWKKKFRKLPYGKGVGFAIGAYLSGAGLPIYWNNMPQSAVQLKLDRSGLVTIFCGSTDIGQGSDSILAYIVAEILGIHPLDDTKVVTADTDLTPVDLGSYSSRVTLMTGNAAIQAATRAREIIAKAVSEKLKVAESRLTFADRRVFDVENPQTGVSWVEAVRIAEAKFGTLGTTGSYVPPRTPARYKGAGVGPSPTYSYSASVCEVTVEPDSGIVKVDKIWIAHDIGRAINTVLTVGQIEGGVYMALGEALMEEQEFHQDLGVHKIPSMLEYKSPTTFEAPEIITYLIEDPDDNGPFGAKEVGQGPLLPVVPAIANAVHDAVGVRIDEIPIHPDKVLKAMKSKDKRFGPKNFPTIEYPEAIKVLTPWQGGDGNPVEGRKSSMEKVVYRGG